MGNGKKKGFKEEKFKSLFSDVVKCPNPKKMKGNPIVVLDQRIKTSKNYYKDENVFNFLLNQRLARTNLIVCSFFYSN